MTTNTLVGARRMKTDLCTENVVVHTNFANRSNSNSPILGRHKTNIPSSTANNRSLYILNISISRCFFQFFCKNVKKNSFTDHIFQPEQHVFSIVLAYNKAMPVQTAHVRWTASRDEHRQIVHHHN